VCKGGPGEGGVLCGLGWSKRKGKNEEAIAHEKKGVHRESRVVARQKKERERCRGRSWGG